MPKLPPALFQRGCDCLNNKTTSKLSTFCGQAEEDVQQPKQAISLKEYIEKGKTSLKVRSRVLKINRL